MSKYKRFKVLLFSSLTFGWTAVVLTFCGDTDPEEVAPATTEDPTGTPHGSNVLFCDWIADMDEDAAMPFGLKLISRRSLRADLSLSWGASLPKLK